MTIFCYKRSPIYLSQGRSLHGAVSYELRTETEDRKTGRKFSYTGREDLIFSEILTPDGSPDWISDKQSLIDALIDAEQQRKGYVAMGLILSIPREIPPHQRHGFARDFVIQEMVSQGFCVFLAGHNSIAADGKDQPHFHVITSLRKVDEKSSTGFAKRKTRYLYLPGQIREGRARFADYTNRALADVEVSVRVSPLTLKQQRDIEIKRSEDTALSPEDRQIARARAIWFDRPPERTRGYRGRSVLRAEIGRRSRPIDHDSLDARSAIKAFGREIQRLAFFGTSGTPAATPPAHAAVRSEDILESEYGLSTLVGAVTDGAKIGAGIADVVEAVIAGAASFVSSPTTREPGAAKSQGKRQITGAVDDDLQKRRKRMTATERTRQKFAIERRREAAGETETRSRDQTVILPSALTINRR